MLLDRIEKLGRIVLWLAIASTCVIAPIAYLKHLAAEAQLKEGAEKAEVTEAAKKAKAELEEQTDKTRRLTLASMGEFLTSLGTSQAQIVFTNVSPRAGFLCVYGLAKNRVTQKSTTSIPACKAVTPYESSVTLTMLFAGGEMSSVCPNSSCSLDVTDAPEAREGLLAGAPAPVATP